MFDSAAFNRTDAAAKQAFIRLFYQCEKFRLKDGTWPKLVEPSDPYIEDFQVFNHNGKHIANVEVEVKEVWTKFEFPYPDIQLLPRKRHFWIDDNDPSKQLTKTMFVMFNAPLTNHLAILSDDARNVYLRNDRVSYGSKISRNDAFYIARHSDVHFGYLFN